jgi:hypothetical protein
MKKREPVDPVTGITPGAMRTLLKSNLRPIWRRTSRKKFIEAMRYKAENPATGRQWFVVDCACCGRVMGVSEKERRPLKKGGLSKKARSVYEIHHKDGITALTDIRKTLGEFWHGLIYGGMEVVCHACHKDLTAKQTKQRTKK